MRPADFYTGIVPEVYTSLRGTHFSSGRYRSFVQLTEHQGWNWDAVMTARSST